MQYRITIGMPVYNVEDYIKQSLTCALNQDLNLVEILIVDDPHNKSPQDYILHCEDHKQAKASAGIYGSDRRL